ncbi:MAG: TIGR03435 family protein [Acidobacteriota bacterium]
MASTINRRSAIILLAAAIEALAQPPAAPRPRFEVAVIKPIASLQQARADPNFSLGMKITAQQVTIRLPLEPMIEVAYNVTQSQIEGPDWLVKNQGGPDYVVFEIAAKMPDGATEAQVPLMLQALLEDRFKATVRKTSKQGSMYALTVGKDGPKFPKKEGPAEPERSPATRDIAVGQQGGQIGGATVSQTPNGGMRIEASSPGGLIFLLERLLSPAVVVVDKTGLQGAFDIKVDVPPITTNNLGGPANAADVAQMRKDLIAEGLGKIGLKLEQQKGLVDTIVVEHMEKAPTEN